MCVMKGEDYNMSFQHKHRVISFLNSHLSQT